MRAHDWSTTTPEAQGVDPDGLNDLLDLIGAHRLNMHSLLIARHGHLIMEAYWHPYHVDSRHDVRSIAKGITALLVGVALHERHLPDLDQRVLGFFVDRVIADRDTRKEAITLRHLLTMTSGLALTDADTEHCLTEADALQWVLDAPMAAEPGAEFVYSSSNYYLLSAVIQRATGRSLDDYASTKLFAPLGIEPVRWQAGQQAITLGWGGLWLASRDLAKIGQLVLARGRWAGAQIVPETWIDTMTSVQRPDASYGFGWWIEPERGTVAMTGYGGQFARIWPQHDLLIVVTSGVGQSLPALDNVIDTALRPALHTGPLAEKPRSAERLTERIAALGRPQPHPVPDLPEIAHRISGRRWRLDSNSLGLTAITLRFEYGSAVLTLESGEDRATIPLALDGVLRDVLVERLGPLANQDRMAATGSWRGDRALDMCWYSVNNPEYWNVELAFEETRACLRWKDALSGYKETVVVQP
jgi:CubicO group peptidase (beta-lactamase class C family)